MAIIMEYLNEYSKVVCTGDCSRRLTEREREKERYDYYLDTIKILDLIDGFFLLPFSIDESLKDIIFNNKRKVISAI